jgi:hypothetical protein
MDVIEMHTAVDLGLQRIGSNALDNFYPEEVDWYLNDSVNKYIKLQVGEIREAGDNHVPAHENLRTLVEYGSISLGAYTLGSSRSGALPSDFHLFLGANVEGATSSKQYRTDLVTPTEFLRHQPTESDQPVFRHLPLTLIGGDLVTVGDVEVGEVVDTAHLIYIKTPATILRDDVTPGNNVSCDLPSHTHQEVVDLAVRLMVEDLYQSGPKRDDGT